MFNIDFNDVDRKECEESHIIEKLESKLAEKEKELKELKIMKESEIQKILDALRKDLREELANVKEEIKREVKNDVVRDVVNELRNELYDLKKSIENEGLKVERLTTVEAKVVELSKTVENLAKEILYIRSEKALQVKSKPSRDKIKQHLKTSKTVRLVEESDDSDIIICD